MNKYLVIGIIAVLVVIFAAFFIFGLHSTEDVKIDILGDGKIEEGESIHIKLTSNNGTPLKDKKVSIAVLNKNGNPLNKIHNRTLKTDSNGKISYSHENMTKGTYIVKVIFEGDDKYSANETTKKIKVKEKKVVESTSENEAASEVSESVEATSSESQDPNDLDGDGMPDVFYSESYNDEDGLIQYYDTRDGQRLTVYEDGEYYLEDSNGYVDSGYM